VSLSSSQSSSHFDPTTEEEKGSQKQQEEEEKQQGRLINLYVVGDSHILPMSNRTFQSSCSNTNYEFLPRLVTGLKLFHLHPTSKHYAKVSQKMIIGHSNVVCLFCIRWDFGRL